MKIQETIREDGLRMISCALPGSKRIYTSLVAEVGSACDPEERLGQHHFDEHMAFNGTSSRSQENIQSFLEEHMKEQNAFTGRLRTIYYTEAVHYKMPLACDLLADIYCNSTVPEEPFKREKNIIESESAAAKDDDSDHVSDLIGPALWRDNPIKQPILGYPETLARITRGDILEAHKKWHVPANTVAIAVGRVSHDNFVHEISGRIPMNDARCPLKNDWDDEAGTPPVQTEIVLEKDGREQATILYGIKMPKYDIDAEKDNLVEDVFFRMMNSRLFSEIRGKRGLVYSVGAGRFGEPELACHFGVMAFSKHPQTVVDLIPELLSQPMNDRKKFDQAKEFYRATFEIGFDGAELINFMRGILIRLAKTSPLELLGTAFERNQKLLTRVTLEEVEALRQKICVPANAATVMIKPS